MLDFGGERLPAGAGLTVELACLANQFGVPPIEFLVLLLAGGRRLEELLALGRPLQLIAPHGLQLRLGLRELVLDVPMLGLHRAVQRSEFFELVGDFLLVGRLAEPRLELRINLVLRLAELSPGLLQGGLPSGQALVQLCQLLFVPGEEDLPFLLLRVLGFFPLASHSVELFVEAIHVRHQPVPIHRQPALGLPKGAQLPLPGSQLLS